MKLNLVAPRTGLRWVGLGVRTFWRQPLALGGLFFIVTLLISLASLLPVLGTLLTLLLPAATLGLMAATREAEQGRFPLPAVLLSGLRGGRAQARAMLTLGILYVLVFLVVLALSALADGGQLARAHLLGQGLTPQQLQSPAFANALLIVLGLSLPLTLLFSHAPALVHWYGVPPLKSLFFSVVGFARNIGAILVFLAGWMGLSLAVGFAAMLLVTVLLNPGDLATLLAVLQPVGLVLTAMFTCSVYFTFRDSYQAGGTETDAAPPAAAQP
jgi:hypothetical protein